MLSKVFSFGLLGIEAYPIEIEVDVSRGLPAVTLVGLADTSIRESKERVKTAIRNSGFDWPSERITVSLAPSGIKKEGACFDLAIALGILSATQQMNSQNLQDYSILGELSLDGSLRPVKGVIAIGLMAKENGFKTVIVPKINTAEAALIPDLEVIGAENLSQLLLHLEGKILIKSEDPAMDSKNQETEAIYPIDMAHIQGQEHAKRALEIAAAGGHNVLMSGPPGSGKTLLGRAFTSILPLMNHEEALEVSQIYSVAGLLAADQPLIRLRPFRAPHHTASAASLIGGGTSAKPGEITLAHRGVLFLDEFPEFPRQVLEALRQPLEEGKITVSRIQHTATYPAKFILIGALNPCPCGYFSDPEKECKCSPTQLIKYKRRLSGPILDRIDLHIEVPRVKYQKLISEEANETSETIRQRIEKARKIQGDRLGKYKILTNSEMNLKQIKKYCQLNQECQDIMRQAVTNLKLSARAYHRLLKLSRTIADLEGADEIYPYHLTVALQYRPTEEP